MARILHLAHQYLPEHVGGTELYTHWTAHRLAQRGHKIAIFYRRFAEDAGLTCRQDPDGVQVWAAWSGPLNHSRRFLSTFKEPFLADAFAQVLCKVQPELVHIQHLMGLPVQLVNLLQQKNIPFVITLHDYWWVCANAQLVTNYSQRLCDGPKAYLNCARCVLARSAQPHLWPLTPAMAVPLAWRNRQLRQVLRSARRLIAPSDFVRRWYAAHGVDPQKIEVIPHGLDSPPARSNPPKSAEAPLRFAYIGGLSWQKGVHVLLQAFAGLEPPAELWIAGDESADPIYVAGLQAQASPGVRFLGKLTREQVWDTLGQIDVVVVPSLWYEAFSFIVSEAFAAGAPVIASQLGPLPDRVQHEVNGLLTPPNDASALRAALARFVRNPNLLARLRAAIPPARTLDDQIDELETLYKSILITHPALPL